MDKDLLEYELKKRKITVNEVCEKIGLSRSAFYRKCNGITEFTLSEINKIVDIIGFESAIPIFFASSVS
ncbi:MAG: helix-turn-helix transcriptional regulator [Clostridia bacterium]|nr:helix-turn-helix transcriptional regulator [Clostridia bacterium]